MAITYIVGIPRSGKTYYVMYLLWKFFVYVRKITWFTKVIDFILKPEPLHNYDLAYTNINEFDFKKTDKIKKLDFDDLYVKLSELYSMFMAKKTDSEIKEKAKVYNLINVLITIDEVQNFLGKKLDDVLVWWLTYHGHLHQDLFFITQDMGLIHSDYKKNAEFFYRAIPPSARLSTKRFRYTQYRNALMAMNGKIKDFTIPAIPEIYNMYVSGAENKSKSVVQKFLFIGLGLFFIFLIAVLLFINSFDTSIENKDLNKTNNYIKENKNSKIFINESFSKEIKEDEKLENILFNIKCIKDICIYKNVDFPKPLLTKIIIDIKPQFYYFFENSTYTQYFILTKKDTFNFLQLLGGKGNEKNTKDDKKIVNPSFSLLQSTS